jgi:hypothetical protein
MRSTPALNLPLDGASTTRLLKFLCLMIVLTGVMVAQDQPNVNSVDLTWDASASPDVAVTCPPEISPAEM